jgi:predicted acylesterase/phospholipase RssA
MDTKRRAINVALGGGGVKGLVHVGVLGEIVRRDVEIASIVGTSVGAMIGAIFAYNRGVRFKGEPQAQKKAHQALEHVCLDTDLEKLKDIDFSVVGTLLRGFLKGQALEDWLKTQMWDGKTQDGIRFGDLDFKLVVTATDAHTGDSVELSRKDSPVVHVHRAVRASIAIQGAFRDIAIEVNGRRIRCWDGGSTGNCRFDLAYRMDKGLDTLGSSITYGGGVVQTDASILTAGVRPIKLINQSAGILMRRLETILEDHFVPDGAGRIRIVRPGFGDVSTLDFGLKREKKKELFNNGRVAAAEALDALGYQAIARAP